MIGVDQAARMPLARATWRVSRHSGSRATSAEITGSRRNAAVPLVPASGPILVRLIEGWLADLERILGTVKDAEIDARFVEGVLVEAHRS